jgi:transposase
MIKLSDDERATLMAALDARNVTEAMQWRIRIVLRTAEGARLATIARELEVSTGTVSHWRKRFIDAGIEGLQDTYRGKPVQRTGQQARRYKELVSMVTPTVRGYLAQAAAYARADGVDAATQEALDEIARIGITPP